MSDSSRQREKRKEMKRRVKVLTPLEDYKVIDVQLLDPRSPNFCTKVHDNSNDAELGRGSASWDGGTGNMQSAAKRADLSQGRFSSMPEVLRSLPGSGQPQMLTGRPESSKTAYPSVPTALVSSKRLESANGSPKGMEYEGSTQSDSSATSVVDFEPEERPRTFCRDSRQLAKPDISKSHPKEELGVHAAARKSLEQSVLDQKSRQTSKPVTIPTRKNSPRRFFGF